MKDKNYSSIQIKTKQLLAWALSIQIAGVTYAIPALSLLSSLSVSSLAFAGDGSTVPGAPPPKKDKDKKDSTPAYLEEVGGHGEAPVTETAPAKKKFCRDESGKWLASCTVAILLGIATIVAIIAYSRKSSDCKSCSNPPPRPRPPGRPDERPPPYPGNPGGGNRPPAVPCCNLPAPAPTGGGTTETSQVVTGSSPIPSVEPIIVSP